MPGTLPTKALAEVVDEVGALGLDTVTLAGSYHAGKFLRPHGRSGKVYFPEDGTVYFRADPARYGRIKPVLNSLIRERDILREIADGRRIAVNAWLVLLHNTPARRGLSGRDGAERLRRSLRLQPLPVGAGGARICGRALQGRDRQLSGHRHLAGDAGFPALRARLPPRIRAGEAEPLARCLLGLCFCEHCTRGAEAAGIETGRLKSRLREDIEAYLAGDFDLPDDMAEAFWLADVTTNGRTVKHSSPGAAMS